MGLLGDDGLSVFVRPPNQDSPSEEPVGPRPLELFVRSFGPETELANRLVGQVRAWDAAGRPSSEGLRIRAYQGDTDYVPSTNEFLVRKRWTQLVLDWE